jgi:hypothetical protein
MSCPVSVACFCTVLALGLQCLHGLFLLLFCFFVHVLSCLSGLFLYCSRPRFAMFTSPVFASFCPGLFLWPASFLFSPSVCPVSCHVACFFASVLSCSCGLFLPCSRPLFPLFPVVCFVCFFAPVLSCFSGMCLFCFRPLFSPVCCPVVCFFVSVLSCPVLVDCFWPVLALCFPCFLPCVLHLSLLISCPVPVACFWPVLAPCFLPCLCTCLCSCPVLFLWPASELFSPSVCPVYLACFVLFLCSCLCGLFLPCSRPLLPMFPICSRPLFPLFPSLLYVSLLRPCPVLVTCVWPVVALCLSCFPFVLTVSLLLSCFVSVACFWPVLALCLPCFLSCVYMFLCFCSVLFLWPVSVLFSPSASTVSCPVVCFWRASCNILFDVAPALFVALALTPGLLLLLWPWLWPAPHAMYGPCVVSTCLMLSLRRFLHAPRAN